MSALASEIGCQELLLPEIDPLSMFSKELQLFLRPHHRHSLNRCNIGCHTSLFFQINLFIVKGECLTCSENGHRQTKKQKT